MEMKIEPLALPGVDTQRPIVIAGPCSAETEEQVLETAQGLASRGVKIFRAGIWKPRTKPGGFEGIGAEGLAWLKKVKKERYQKAAEAAGFSLNEFMEKAMDSLAAEILGE